MPGYQGKKVDLETHIQDVIGIMLRSPLGFIGPQPSEANPLEGATPAHCLSTSRRPWSACHQPIQTARAARGALRVPSDDLLR